MTVAVKRMQQNFSRAAAHYDAHAWLQQQQTDRALAAALKFLPTAGRMLDIGCGTGQFALKAKKPRPNWHIVGLDFSFAMAAQAARRCAALQGNAEALPIASHSVDGVVSSLCLQWVNDKPAMLREIRRVLKPGGVAIITTLGQETLKELRAAATRSHVPLGLLSMCSFADYRAMAVGSGMQLVGGQHMLESHHYSSVEALLASMRRIGAGNAQGERGRAFITPRRFAQLIQHYEAAHGGTRGIPATWEPILLVLKNA